VSLPDGSVTGVGKRYAARQEQIVWFTISLIHHIATPNTFCRSFRCPSRARRSSATGLGAAREAAAI